MAGTMATTSADSNQTSPPFFSKIYNNNSFSELLNGVGAEEAGYVGDGLPRFKSTPPPSLPISQPSIFSPSNYFAIPAGLSPAELLDSPVLHAHSHVSSFMYIHLTSIDLTQIHTHVYGSNLLFQFIYSWHVSGITVSDDRSFFSGTIIQLEV